MKSLPSVLLLILILASAFYLIPFRTGFVIKDLNSKDFDSNPSVPNNWINESQIEIQKDKVIIHINNSQISEFGNTSSMLPLIGKATNGIVITPSSPEQINAGDIIAFAQDNSLVVHRVIEIGADNEGWYALTKGDNTQVNDGKIRFEQIRYVVVALVY